MISYTSYGFFLLVSAGLILSGFVRPKRKKWILLAMSLIFLAMAGGALSIWIWMISTAAARAEERAAVQAADPGFGGSLSAWTSGLF